MTATATLTKIEPASALALDLSPTLALPEWRTMGDKLRSTRLTIDWLIGDWIAHGRAHFPDQAEPVIADLFPDSREARRVEKVAKAFPAHLRNDALTFEHHAKVADMPVQEALPLLKRAAKEGMTAGQLRLAAMARKLETGQILVRDDDDAYDRQITALTVEWNRAMQSVRDDFREMAEEAGWGLIEI